MTGSPNAIFLSYASQDAEAARRICDALVAVGLEVWFDRSELRGGDTWDASIRRQIKECALFVPIISANTQAREEGYFRREWNLAVNRTLDMADDRAFLVPVVIDATIDMKAPRVPEKFREVQWTRLPAGESPAAFAERVRRLLSCAAGPPQGARPPGGERRAAPIGGDHPSAAGPPQGARPPGGTARSADRGDPVSGTAPAPIAPPRAVPAAAPADSSNVRESPSIAVLPFVNMSRDEENEYFADGLAEELLNVLAKIRGLRVVARSSAFAFKGKGATVAEVGRTLNVATVLEGSVRKAGSRMRIAVQLVKVVDGYQLWSKTYDRTLEDIFAVQDDIAQSVVNELRTTLLGEAATPRAGNEATAQVAAAVKGRSTDPEAHRLFLQARHFIDRSTREDVAKGIGHLKKALAVEPEFALAWAELGRAYAWEADWGAKPVDEAYRRARDAVAQALALEPDLAEGHSGLGWIRMLHDWDWRGAEASYRRALELAPGNALILHQASLLAGCLGHFDEAIRLAHCALKQDPLSASAHFFFGTVLWVADRLADAVTAYGKTLKLAPQRAATRCSLSLCLLGLGRADEALAEALREPEEWARLHTLAIIHHTTGRPGESDKALRELAGRYADSAAYQVAEVHAVRGESNRAFEWLERAYAQRDAGVAWTKVDLLLRSLHFDPRWDAFLRKLGLAD